MAKPTYNFDPIHGRDSFRARLELDDDSGTELDLGSHPIWLEIPAAGLRKQLAADTADGDPLAVVMELTRAEVDLLPTTPSDFAIIDEVNAPDFPNLLFSGTIYRNGYIGFPGLTGGS